MRFPDVDLSDRRSSPTMGPRFRHFLIKLQPCIFILLDRICGAGKMFTDEDRRWHQRSWRTRRRFSAADDFNPSCLVTDSLFGDFIHMKVPPEETRHNEISSPSIPGSFSLDLF